MSRIPNRQMDFQPLSIWVPRAFQIPKSVRRHEIRERRNHKRRVRAYRRRQQEEEVKQSQPQPPPKESAAPVKPPQLSNYWPDITTAIRKCKWGYIRGIPRSDIAIGTATCSICGDSDLVIDELQYRRTKGELLIDGVTQEDRLLTACGHVLGRQCLEIWEQQCHDNEQAFTCPCCRFDLDPPRCWVHRLTAIIDLTDSKLTWIGADGIRPDGHRNKEVAANCSACTNEGLTRRERGLDLYGRPPGMETSNLPKILVYGI